MIFNKQLFYKIAKKKKSLFYLEFIATFILPLCIMISQKYGGKKKDEEKNICHNDGDADECNGTW